MPTKAQSALLWKYAFIFLAIIFIGSFFYKGSDGGEAETEAESSSSSSASGDLLEDTGSGSSSSSVIAVDHGPTQPFDGCAKLSTYATQPWYEILKSEFAAQFLDFTDERIPVACSSSQYVIFLYADVGNTSSIPYRYVIAENILEKASAPTGTGSTIKGMTFAKREGDTVPLLATIGGRECRSELYDVRKNSVAVTENKCRDNPPECTGGYKVEDNGWGHYPIFPVYSHLHATGEIFTAYECDVSRFNALFKGLDLPYKPGTSIWLNTAPSVGLKSVLDSLGYTCESEDTNNCTLWNQHKETMTYRDLLKFKPYYKEIKEDAVLRGG